jgi:glc operon protein GlcG
MQILKAGAAVLAFAATALAADGALAAKKTLTLEGARKVIAGAIAEARKNNECGVIAVVDDGGNLIAVERIDGTFAAGANISIGKARTAALFKKPTKFFEDVIGKGRTSMVTLNDFTPLQGGVPIMVSNEIVGAVGVSGAKSAADDEHLAMAGAAALLDEQTSKLPVSYIESPNVAAAFQKGVPLLEQANYKIHASRREGNGQAEIHTRDTDIVHVLSGTATLITGGSAVNAKGIAPDELRGDSIRDGETRQLVTGDVVVIPNGIPHQFLGVTAPFTYYVVKVRSDEGGM